MRMGRRRKRRLEESERERPPCIVGADRQTKKQIDGKYIMETQSGEGEG